MGKARILSAQGQGLYSIEILEDRTRAESRKTLAEQRISQIDSELTDLEQDLDDAQQAVDDGAAAQDQAIADYQAEPTVEHRKAMEEQAAKLIKLAEARDAVRLTTANLNLERLTLQTAIDRVGALPALRQGSAWCADYTEDLSGEVATAEVPGEIGQVIIRPGFDDGAAWSASEDGAIQPALAGAPASVFYNLAMMPGWQKWRPTFRIATISNINNDLCDITLDAATSSQQGLNVNAQGSYSDVPIYYMDCNGDAFENGDKVLVAFSGNTDLPIVVGFEQNPRECQTYRFQIPSTVDLSVSLGQMMDRPGGAVLAFKVSVPMAAQYMLRWNSFSFRGEIALALCELDGLVISDVLGYFWESTTSSVYGYTFPPEDDVTLEPGKIYALVFYSAQTNAKLYRHNFDKAGFFGSYDWLEQAFPEYENKTLVLAYERDCTGDGCNDINARPMEGDDLSIAFPGAHLKLLENVQTARTDLGFIERVTFEGKPPADP